LLRLVRAGGHEKATRRLAWLNASVCVGSVAGAVTWVLSYHSNVAFYNEIDALDTPLYTSRQRYTSAATASRLFAGFLVCYGIELLCMIVSKLLLLGLLADNATQNSQACTPNIALTLSSETPNTFGRPT